MEITSRCPVNWLLTLVIECVVALRGARAVSPPLTRTMFDKKSVSLRGACRQMVVSEGMELVIMFFVIVLNLLILVWLQKWSGLT